VFEEDAVEVGEEMIETFSGRGRGGRQGPQDRRMRENGGPNPGRGGNVPRPTPRDRMDECGREPHRGPPPQQSRQGNGPRESDRASTKPQVLYHAHDSMHDSPKD
jgi:hypothetical protein